MLWQRRERFIFTAEHFTLKNSSSFHATDRIWRENQLGKALDYNEDDDTLEKLQPLLFSFYTNSVKLNVANSVRPSEAFQMTAKYKREMETDFKCQMQNLDYEKDAQESRKKN